MHTGQNSQYLKRYQALLASVEPKPKGTGRSWSDEFFGWNAVEYAGLKPGDKARVRLDNFYNCHCVSKPVWMQKVDRGLKSA